MEGEAPSPVAVMTMIQTKRIFSLSARFRGLLLPAFAASALSGAAFAQEQPSGAATFPFVLPWDDATSTAVDVSRLNPAPLEEKHRITARNGHFYDTTGRRVRFLGVNLAFSMNFPDKTDAGKIAARMHKYGINMVRLHHMDSARTPAGILAKTPDSQTLDPEQLDRLDYFVAECKKHGIYVDLNLHVGRDFTEADGFPEAKDLPRQSKAIAYFDPRMIELQKKYAKDLLEHVNPYTKLSYANDPVVALIELNNENTILGSNDTLRGLPEHYRDQIEKAWNDFLKAKYKTTAAALSAWQVPAAVVGENLITNGQLTDGTKGWQIESPAPAKGEMIVLPDGGPKGQGNALHFKITAAGAQNAILQVQIPNLTIEKDSSYRISFWAKADMPRRQIGVNMLLNKAPWSGLGFYGSTRLTTDWKQYTYIFKATADADKSGKLSFSSPKGTLGDVWIAGVKLEKGSGFEVEGQSLEQGTFVIPSSSPNKGLTADFYAFLVDVEQRYVDTLNTYIKDTLKARAPLTCSQSGWGGVGGIVREAKLDFVDMHAYWHHPEFPGRAFDGKEWTVTNKPLVVQNDGGTLSNLAMHRVVGKPYTISEYNHPAPNEFAVETMPMLAGFAAWQDWDGIMLFAYQHDRKHVKDEKFTGWFNIANDPAKMAYFPAAAALFLGGQLPPAQPRLTLTIPQDSTPQLLAKGGGSFWKVWHERKVSNNESLKRLTGVRVVDGAGDTQSVSEPVPPAAQPFLWRAERPTDAVFKVSAPNARFLVGFPSDAWTQNEGFSIRPAKTQTGMVSAALHSTDDKPIREAASVVLTLGTRFENVNMGWNEARTSVSNRWGEAPVHAEGVTAEIEIETAAKKVTVHALDGTGARKKVVPSELKDGKVAFKAAPEHQTVWYEVVRE